MIGSIAKASDGSVGLILWRNDRYRGIALLPLNRAGEAWRSSKPRIVFGRSVIAGVAAIVIGLSGLIACSMTPPSQSFVPTKADPAAPAAVTAQSAVATVDQTARTVDTQAQALTPEALPTQKPGLVQTTAKLVQQSAAATQASATAVAVATKADAAKQTDDATIVAANLKDQADQKTIAARDATILQLKQTKELRMWFGLASLVLVLGGAALIVYGTGIMSGIAGGVTINPKTMAMGVAAVVVGGGVGWVSLHLDTFAAICIGCVAAGMLGVVGWFVWYAIHNKLIASSLAKVVATTNAPVAGTSPSVQAVVAAAQKKLSVVAAPADALPKVVMA
jgi:hypothetical protein